MLADVLVEPAAAAAPARTDLLVIVVSLADIRDGVQGDGENCAVAVALKRAGHSRVDVRTWGIRADGVAYDTTGALEDWIRDFDARGAFPHPDRFVLSPRVPA